jgi:hypothetical protein
MYNVLSIGRASVFVMPRSIAPGRVLGITGKLSMQR